ncbi:hypothetical protein AVEN_274266-1 [Araneus ventricosus]|uniref:Uncharacterized protein n=1 Tax=Araneus ventricosus TaxID=182803 RepID=A0A4Y2RUC9_ARAVE|nr:hypothetical protein AVEN_274266-1 [Araneus ventricosus]
MSLWLGWLHVGCLSWVQEEDVFLFLRVWIVRWVVTLMVWTGLGGGIWMVERMIIDAKDDQLRETISGYIIQGVNKGLPHFKIKPFNGDEGTKTSDMP